MSPIKKSIQSLPKHQFKMNWTTKHKIQTYGTSRGKWYAPGHWSVSDIIWTGPPKYRNLKKIRPIEFHKTRKLFKSKGNQCEKSIKRMRVWNIWNCTTDKLYMTKASANKCWWDGEKKGLVHCHWMIVTAFMENTGGPLEAEIEIYFDPAVPPIGVYAKVMQINSNVYCSTIHNNQKGKEHKWTLTDEWRKCDLCTWIDTTIPWKECNSFICENTGEARDS